MPMHIGSKSLWKYIAFSLIDNKRDTNLIAKLKSSLVKDNFIN